jgi:large-conductance mechanosensitive channel
MLEVLKIFYEILVSPFEVQLLDFFSVWGIVIQTLITLLISSITIWLMIKYGENQKMIGELKNHTMILSKQYEILYEINKPFITIEC